MSSNSTAADELQQNGNEIDAELRAYVRSFLTPLLPIFVLGLVLILVA